MKLNVISIVAVFIGVFLSFSTGVRAESETESRTSMESIETEVPDKADDVDAVITNIKMRAETGGKSKWSIATAMGYSAGPVNDLLSNNRPNLSGTTGSTDFTTLSGSVSVKYNLASQHAVFGGIGMRLLTPLLAGTPEKFNGEKFDIDNPYITYQYLYLWQGIQSAVQVNQQFFTNSNLLRDGYVTQTNLSQNNIYDLGSSRFSIGLNLFAGFGFFNDDSLAARRNQTDYSFGLTPALEYRINDWINARTELYLYNFQHRRTASTKDTFDRQRVVQGFTLGFAISRDVYVSPGMQWIPEEITPERTTTWLAANLNF